MCGMLESLGDPEAAAQQLRLLDCHWVGTNAGVGDDSVTELTEQLDVALQGPGFRRWLRQGVELNLAGCFIDSAEVLAALLNGFDMHGWWFTGKRRLVVSLRGSAAVRAAMRNACVGVKEQSGGRVECIVTGICGASDWCEDLQDLRPAERWNSQRSGVVSSTT